MTRSRFALTVPPVAACLVALASAAAQDGGPRSLMSQALDSPVTQSESGNPHALLDNSLFAILPPEMREFQQHDLVQIIVRESSRAESKHELDAEKEWLMEGGVTAWPDFRLDELLQLQIRGGRDDNMPLLQMGLRKDFEGDGEYKRRDDMTARLSAEVIEILPNGNLILEARTQIVNDEEIATIKVTGVCRADDVTPANTVLSSQIHDLRIEKMHKGELKKANEKGILAKLLETVFAF